MSDFQKLALLNLIFFYCCSGIATDSTNSPSHFSLRLVSVQNLFDPAEYQLQGAFTYHLLDSLTNRLGYEKFNSDRKEAGFIQFEQELWSYFSIVAQYYQQNWYYIYSSRKSKMAALKWHYDFNSSWQISGSAGYYERTLCQLWHGDMYRPLLFNGPDVEGWYLLGIALQFDWLNLRHHISFANWDDFFLGSSDLWRFDLSWKWLNEQAQQLTFGMGVDISGLSSLAIQPINYHLFMRLVL